MARRRLSVYDRGPPGYSRRSAIAIRPLHGEQTQHVFGLGSDRGNERLSLRVQSRAPTSKTRPVWIEGDTITGSIHLNLEKPEQIKGIKISVQGGTAFHGRGEWRFADGNKDEWVFMKITQDVWTPDMGEGTSSERSKPSSARLQGSYDFPFSLALPSEIDLPNGLGLFKPPPSFTDKGSVVCVEYKLSVTIKRPLLRSDQILTMRFSYIPVSHPDPVPGILQAEGNPFLGHGMDSNRWIAFSPTSVGGSLFRQRDVVVEYTIAIADPPSYCVGSSLPLLLRVKSKDSLALDLMSSPSAFQVQLVRHLSLNSCALDDNTARHINGCDYFRETLVSGFFQARNDLTSQPDTKILEGEVHIGRTVYPTFVFPRISVRYTLEMLLGDTPGFLPSITKQVPIFSTGVKIVTASARGMIPPVDSPPEYSE